MSIPITSRHSLIIAEWLETESQSLGIPRATLLTKLIEEVYFSTAIPANGKENPLQPSLIDATLAKPDSD